MLIGNLKSKDVCYLEPTFNLGFALTVVDDKDSPNGFLDTDFIAVNVPMDRKIRTKLLSNFELELCNSVGTSVMGLSLGLVGQNVLSLVQGWFDNGHR